METHKIYMCQSLEVALVLILPMRNGNNILLNPIFPNVQPVLILPMRNGNLVRYYRYRLRLIVLILPMRNGNYHILYVVVQKL